MRDDSFMHFEQLASARSMTVDKLTFLVLCAAAFLDMGDQFGLPGLFLAMQRELSFGAEGIAAIVTSQNVALAVFSPVWGWLADKYDRVNLLTASCLMWAAINVVVLALFIQRR